MRAERTALIFTFDNVRLDRGGPNEYYAILLGVVGDFTITVAGKTLYAEEEFCLAEFAVQLASWWQRRASALGDFSYESLESDEVGLIWIRAHDASWQIGARHQEYEETGVFPLETIDEAVRGYVTALQRELAMRFALDLSAFMRLHAARYSA